MSRIYIVGYGQETRLVRANTRAQALNHVAQGIIKHRKGTLMPNGVFVKES